MHLSWPGGPLRGTAQLPASKSEANRALILQALAGGGTLGNLSDANDTQLMRRLLAAAPATNRLDAEDAGTVMRFLTAYLSFTGWRGQITGTARAQERPIAVLVDALRQSGARITYLENEGFPPLEFAGLVAADAAGPGEQSIRGDISSQYISALLMLSPYQPGGGGMRLHLTGAVGSRPYIDMTLALMRRFGADCAAEGNTIRVGPTPYQPTDYVIEADWSAASYWYAFVALAPAGSEITLPGLRRDSLQGDQAIADMMTHFGVATTFLPEGIHLQQQAIVRTAEPLALDFSACPDLAQTIAVVAAALAVPVAMTGLESLRIKETDRIAALQTELAKFGVALQNVRHDSFAMASEGLTVANQSVATYHDHRMAMAFAPLALRGLLTIESPTVVRKSYPQFWKELANSGFAISEAG
ncbi:MAG: 3-phosphoshikimate 1-carboxyvinyltransferase [Bacteroidota bacterium]|nr:3-phosphoshikimate 1-carboxyvinyltransferase [Bacteroidota bacterium]